MQFSYDIEAGALIDVRVGDAQLAETLLGLPLREGDVLLNDRGFPRRAGIAAVAAQQVHHLGRWSPTGASLQQEDGSALLVEDWLASLPPTSMMAEKPVQSRWEHQIVPLRLLALRLPPEQAEKARQRVRRVASRQGQQVQEKTLLRAGWILLVSTFPQSYWASELFWLYRSRRPIERLIKAMKQLLPLVQLRCHKPEMIRTTLLAWVLVWVWQEEAVQQIVERLQAPRGPLWQLQEAYGHLQQQWQEEEERLAQAHFPKTPAALVPPPETKPTEEATLSKSPSYLSSSHPMASAPSRWVISCCSLQWLQAVVQGQWSWQHLLVCLPRLARFFCPSPRRRRSQHFQLHVWLCFRLAKSPLFSP